jgi:opacity protein-like surface antigen
MMKAILAMVTLLMFIASPAAAADTTDASALVNTPEAFAGKLITVSGELVGDYGFRDNGTVWTQLNDDAYAVTPLRDGGRLSGGNLGIGIHGDADLFKNLDPPGRYNRVGPVVSVTGTWRYHDPERGGETYLQVDTLVVVRSGFPLPASHAPVALAIGALLVIVSAGLLVVARRR